MNAFRQERTNIEPLRWFANVLVIIACEFLIKSIRLEDKNNYGIRYKLYTFIQELLYKPSNKWGTYYTVDKFPKRK